jgi:uncharacterized protein
MKIVIAGGSGTLGQRIAADFAGRGDEVVVLTRSPRDDFPFRQIGWDGRTVGAWAGELEGSVLINLAGEVVDRPPTQRNIEMLRRSRVEPTRALVQASQACKPSPVVWVQASSTAIYGDAGDIVITEEAPIPQGPPQMPGVALPWEQAAKAATSERPGHLSDEFGARHKHARTRPPIDARQIGTGRPDLDRTSVGELDTRQRHAQSSSVRGE